MRSLFATGRARLAAGDDRRPAVVLVHGFGDRLESQSESGELLHRRGHTVLLVDLSAHGASALRRLPRHDRPPRMPESVVRRVLDAHPGPKRIWTAPGAPHAGAANAPGYWEAVLGFLGSNGL